jgi:flagellar biogenesis protein FliO
MRLASAVPAALLAFFLYVEEAAARSAAYNAGYIFGRVIIFVLIIAAVVWLIRRLTRSRSDSA